MSNRKKAHGRHPWIRLNDAQLGMHHPIVMFDVDELHDNGYEPAGLGMERIGDYTARFDIPIVPVTADMTSRYDVDLCEADVEDMNSPTMIVGGTFEDPPPDEWWERVHRDKCLLIVAGDTPTLARAGREKRPDRPRAAVRRGLSDTPTIRPTVVIRRLAAGWCPCRASVIR